MEGDLIYGQNDKGESVVIYLGDPRLILRVVEVSESGEALYPDEDADLLSGICYSGEYEGGQFMLCEGKKLDDDDNFDVSETLRLMGAFAAMHLESERGTHAMDTQELSDLIVASELSVHTFARKMEIDPRSLRRMLKGEMTIPPMLASELRQKWS